MSIGHIATFQAVAFLEFKQNRKKMPRFFAILVNFENPNRQFEGKK